MPPKQTQRLNKFILCHTISSLLKSEEPHTSSRVSFFAAIETGVVERLILKI